MNLAIHDGLLIVLNFINKMLKIKVTVKENSFG